MKEIKIPKEIKDMIEAIERLKESAYKDCEKEINRMMDSKVQLELSQIRFLIFSESRFF